MQHAMQMRRCGASCSRQKVHHAAEAARLAASSSAVQHHPLWHLPAPTTTASSAAGWSTVQRLTSCSAAARDASETRSEKLLRESAQVEDRVSYVDGMSALKVQLAKAGDKLVVLELQGEGVCDSGFDEEAELHWKLDEESQARKRQEACMRIKHVFQRTARDCPDVVFLNMQVPEGVEGEDIKEQLGVQRLPSVIFFKQGELLWQQEGFEGMEQQIGEGVLYYGDSAGGGVKASQYVTELTSLEELHAFMGKQPADMLTVVNVSTSLCTPCVKVYPAVLALAKNFVGQASFARILGDEVHNPHQLMAELRVLEVPTFIFYRNNKEVGRLVGSSRGDFIGHILKLQADAGIRPPPPPPGSGRGSAGRAKARAPAASRWR